MAVIADTVFKLDLHLRILIVRTEIVIKRRFSVAILSLNCAHKLFFFLILLLMQKLVGSEVK